MLLDRLDEHLDAGDLDLPQTDRQRAALFRRDPAGAPVADVAGRVERAEIAADGDVAVLQFEPDAGGLQRPAADHVFQRIVAEQAQMARPAARRDAGERSGCCDPSTPRVASASRFGVRAVSNSVLPPGLHRQAAQAVGHQHDDLRVAFRLQFASQVVDVHRLFLRLKWSLGIRPQRKGSDVQNSILPGKRRPSATCATDALAKLKCRTILSPERHGRLSRLPQKTRFSRTPPLSGAECPRDSFTRWHCQDRPATISSAHGEFRRPRQLDTRLIP